jgi:hypothetical protein
MKTRSLFVLLFAALMLVFSCSDENDTGGDTGKLIVQLTDAPFPHDLVAEANVTIFKIEARYIADIIDYDMEGTIMEEEEEGSPFIVLMEEEILVNLLELTNGVTETLLNTDVPVGTYDLIRVYVKGVNVVLEDGTTYDLKVPSGEQTGIKIFIKPGLTVNGGLTADLLLDFDVSKSFVAKGNLKAISGFNFKPVIKACNRSTTGTLKGLITESVDNVNVGAEGAQVAIFADDTLITTTFTDVDGGYMVMGLDAGLYRVEVEKEGYEMQTVEGIEITVANKTELDFELMAIVP